MECEREESALAPVTPVERVALARCASWSILSTCAVAGRASAPGCGQQLHRQGPTQEVDCGLGGSVPALLYRASTGEAQASSLN